MSFTYVFEYDYDVVYMAFSQPYTYTDLQKYIKSLEDSPRNSKYLVREVLCYTLIGTPCDILTITSHKKKQKGGVVLTGRVHPGETVSSWMIQGVINFLLSDDKIAEQLRNRFIFKIIPMLNPDGVIQGNYRSSLIGHDLNRKYACPSKVFHPTIFHAKKMAKELAKECSLVLYCDFHGHSKNKNVFMYGNIDDEDPELYIRFPYIMSRVNTNFLFKDCRFNVHKSKFSTARIAMWKELGIPAVYTIEASFFGSENKKGDQHFGVEDYMEIGKAVCKSISIYNKLINEETDNRKNSKGRSSRKQKLKQKANESKCGFRNLAANIIRDIKDYKSSLLRIEQSKGALQSNDDSDSNPSEDDLDAKEIMQVIPTELQGEIITKDKIALPNKVKEQKNKSLITSKTLSKATRSDIKISTRHPQNLRRELYNILRRDRREIVEYIEMVDCCTQTTPRNEEIQSSCNKSKGRIVKGEELRSNSIRVIEDKSVSLRIKSNVPRTLPYKNKLFKAPVPSTLNAHNAFFQAVFYFTNSRIRIGE